MSVGGSKVGLPVGSVLLKSGSALPVIVQAE
jgi:hypothetical protein